MADMDRPKAVDLFCGVGGLSLGFEDSGFDIVAAVERDPIHVRAFRRNFPECRVLVHDIAELQGEDICEVGGIASEEIDVVIGGPPCQGFSTMGKRRKDDPRNLLLFEFVRIIEELKPRYWVMENVEGLMIGTAKSVLQSFMKRVRRAGYAVVKPFKTLNAMDYGVPQRRRRVFFLGYRPSLPAPSYPGCDGNAANENKRVCPTVWDAISDLHFLDDCDDFLRKDIYSGELGAGTVYSKILRGEINDSYDCSPRRPRHRRTLTGCRRSAHTEETTRRFTETQPGCYEPVSRFYRLTKNGVSNVLRAGTGRSNGGFTAPRPIHPVTPRCITVREAARLHSFPDWFQFDSTIWHGFRQVGNSVPPLLARAVGTSVKNAILMNHSHLRLGLEA